MIAGCHVSAASVAILCYQTPASPNGLWKSVPLESAAQSMLVHMSSAVVALPSRPLLCAGAADQLVHVRGSRRGRGQAPHPHAGPLHSPSPLRMRPRGDHDRRLRDRLDRISHHHLSGDLLLVAVLCGPPAFTRPARGLGGAASGCGCKLRPGCGQARVALVPLRPIPCQHTPSSMMTRWPYREPSCGTSCECGQ